MVAIAACDRFRRLPTIQKSIVKQLAAFLRLVLHSNEAATAELLFEERGGFVCPPSLYCRRSPTCVRKSDGIAAEKTVDCAPAMKGRIFLLALLVDKKPRRDSFA
jgi:hypothetical protein